jgi:hypothetical protein
VENGQKGVNFLNSHKFIKWVMGWKYILQSFSALPDSDY